ncbi:hypothetical protein GB937_001717 [Aspergillus fischeri]|nr:hypothetical protein GB937_001717 [Aspergillus fischeri]
MYHGLRPEGNNAPGKGVQLVENGTLLLLIIPKPCTPRKVHLVELREGHWVVPEDDGELEGPDQRTDLTAGQALRKEELLDDLGVLKIVKGQQLQRKQELEESLKGL